MMHKFDEQLAYCLEEGLLDWASKTQQTLDNLHQGLADPNKGFPIQLVPPETLKQKMISAQNPPQKGDWVVHQNSQNQPLVVGQVAETFGANFSLLSARLVPQEQLLRGQIPGGTRARLWWSEGDHHRKNYLIFTQQKPSGNWQEVPDYRAYRFGPDYEIADWMKLKDWLHFFKKLPPNPTGSVPGPAPANKPNVPGPGISGPPNIKGPWAISRAGTP